MKTYLIRLPLKSLFGMILALLAAPSVWADKIFLNNGDVISGTIIEESADSVKIEVKIGSIKDTKTVTRVGIAKIEKTTPEDFAFEEIEKLLPTPDGLSAAGYQAFMKGPKDFMTKYPNSTRAPKVQAIIDTLQSELARIEAGSIKFRGNWLNGTQQIAHRGNIDAERKKAQMIRASRNRSTYVTALRIFDDMERTCAGSLAFPEALKLAKSILPRYARYMNDEIKFAQYEAKQRAAGMLKLNETGRIEQERILQGEAARFNKKVQIESEKGWKWISVDFLNESSLRAGIQRAKKEADRLAKIDPEPLVEEAMMIYEAEELISSKKLEDAQEKLKSVAKLKGRAKALSPFKGKEKSLTLLETAKAALAKALERQKKERELASRLNDDSQTIGGSVRLEGEKGKGKGGETEPASGSEAEKLKAKQEALAALKKMGQSSSATSNAPAKVEKKKATPQKRAPYRPPVSTTASSESSSGGGFNFYNLVFILPVGLIGFTVFLFLKNRNSEE